MKAKEIFDFLCEKYPLSTACDFDNPGFLVGDKNTEVTKAIICLDCDDEAVKKAKDIGAQLIISHHPVIFSGIKSVVSENVVYKLIKNDISVISMHTNLDVGEGGVNDCLCEALELHNISPCEMSDGFLIRSCETPQEISTDDFADFIKEKLGFSVRYVGNGDIKKVLVCSGAGGDYFEEAVNRGFDALVTADVKHHQFVAANNSKIALFDCGHYASENIFAKNLAKMLTCRFANVDFTVFSPDYIKFN